MGPCLANQPLISSSVACPGGRQEGHGAMRAKALGRGGLARPPSQLGQGWAGNRRLSQFSAPTSVPGEVSNWAETLSSLGLSFPTRAARAGRDEASWGVWPGCLLAHPPSCPLHPPPPVPRLMPGAGTGRPLRSRTWGPT